MFAHLLIFFQAEHGPDSQVVLVIAGDGVDIGAIETEISTQCSGLPRGQFASKALDQSFIIFAPDIIEVTWQFTIRLKSTSPNFMFDFQQFYSPGNFLLKLVRS